MLKEMLDALMEVWLEKELTPEAEAEYQKLTTMLVEKGLSEKDVALTQEQVMAFSVVVQDDAFRAGFQICLDLLKGGKAMRRTETVMTYEDWCKAHRRTLRKMVKDTITTGMQWAAVGLITVGLPVGMIAHWLLIGY